MDKFEQDRYMHEKKEIAVKNVCEPYIFPDKNLLSEKLHEFEP